MEERQVAVLARLAEAGLEIAKALEDQARGGGVVVQGDVAMAYNRVARAVRQTFMLQNQVIEALRGQGRAWAGCRAAAIEKAAGIVGEVIDDDLGGDPAGDQERRERLRAEAAERLGEEDFGDLLARPFGDVVAEVCRDLGLSPDWLKLAEDCCAAEAKLAVKALAGKAGAAEEEDDIWRGPMEVEWLRPMRPADSS